MCCLDCFYITKRVVSVRYTKRPATMAATTCGDFPSWASTKTTSASPFLAELPPCLERQSPLLVVRQLATMPSHAEGHGLRLAGMPQAMGQGSSMPLTIACRSLSIGAISVEKSTCGRGITWCSKASLWMSTIPGQHQRPFGSFRTTGRASATDRDAVGRDVDRGFRPKRRRSIRSHRQCAAQYGVKRRRRAAPRTSGPFRGNG